MVTPINQGDSFMIYVLTLIGIGYFEQIEMPDHATCRIIQAWNVAEWGEDLTTAKCEWVNYVAA